MFTETAYEAFMKLKPVRRRSGGGGATICIYLCVSMRCVSGLGIDHTPGSGESDKETSTQGVIVALQGLGIGSGKSKWLIGNSLSAVLATVL